MILFVIIVIILSVLLIYGVLKVVSVGEDIDPEERNLILFVNKAHDAFIIAVSEEDTRYFEKYADPNVIHELRDIICYEDQKLYGMDKYRDRRVMVVDESRSHTEVEISVTHGRLKINKTNSVAVGDNIVDMWKVRTRGDKYQVISIGDN